jgi:hypothetical protein
MQRRFPDVICIGAEKAGTTWLFQMLRNQPAFYAPALKELHYFTQVHKPEVKYTRSHRARGAEKIKLLVAKNPNHTNAGARIAEAELIGRAEVDDDWYGSIFAPASPEQVCLDTCPSYLHLPEAGIQHLLALNPKVKLLLFVRDPVDRAWSHIRMNLARGLIADEEAVLNGERIRQYVDNSEYRHSITLWRKFSEPGQLNIMLYDEVASEPEAVLTRVFDIAGLAPPQDFGPIDSVIHRGKDFEFPKVLRAKLMVRLAEQYEFLSSEFPGAVTKWLARHQACLG